MIILSLQHIKKVFGGVNCVLSDASLVAQKGDRIGLIGSNGTGKSTLLRIIADDLTFDDGQMFRQKDLSVGYLTQSHTLDPEATVWEQLLKIFEPVFEMEARLREMEEKMGALHEEDPEGFEKLLADYDRLRERFEETDGYSYQSRIQGVLRGLGFERAQFTQTTDTLSGGQRSRLSLARLLLQKPDLLLLDEPTNHLDLEAVQWLEAFLKDYAGTAVIVSHDRYFLDALCTGIADLSFGEIRQYEGNYTRYQALRAAQIEQERRAYDLQQKEIARLQAIIERYRMFNREKSIRAAESREKQLARIERLEKPTAEGKVRFSFVAGSNTGRDVLIAENLSKSYDKLLFRGINLHIRAGDRIALIGPNGIGKSTLLKILVGQAESDSGYFRLGAGVDPGYYDQQQSDLSSDKTVIEEIWDEHPYAEQTTIRNALASFLFQGEDVFQPVATLSGGERGRLMLLKLMLMRNNFLLLDEPTNHLDMASREVLENALKDFDGTLLMVSHDRYFINKIARKVWVMGENTITEYLGNYSDYLEKAEQMLDEEPEPETVSKTARQKDRRRERQASAQMQEIRARIVKIEEEITALEARQQEIGKRLSGGADGQQALELSREYEENHKRIENKIATWEKENARMEE